MDVCAANQSVNLAARRRVAERPATGAAIVAMDEGKRAPCTQGDLPDTRPTDRCRFWPRPSQLGISGWLSFFLSDYLLLSLPTAEMGK